MADTLVPIVAVYSGTDVVALREITPSEGLTITNYTETLYASGNTGASITVSLSNGTIQLLTLDQNCTITLPTAEAGKSFTVILTGNYVPTWAAASGDTLKWAGGSAPARTASTGKYDIYCFVCIDSTNVLGCDGGRNF